MGSLLTLPNNVSQGKEDNHGKTSVDRYINIVIVIVINLQRAVSSANTMASFPMLWSLHILGVLLSGKDNQSTYIHNTFYKRAIAVQLK